VSRLLTGRLALPLILLLALVFKAGALHAYSRHSPHFERPSTDSEVYVDWARQIQREGWLGEEVFYQAPLYPYGLSLVLPAEGGGLLRVYVLQTLAGMGILLLLFAIGRSAFGRRAGLLAAVMGLAYAPMTFYETKILATVMGMALSLVAIWLLLVAERDEKPWFWAGGSVALGLAVLCRPQLLPVAPLIALGLLLRYRRELRRALIPSLIVLLVPGLFVGAVAARNLAVSGDLVLISANAGVNLAQGNAEGAHGCMADVPGLSGSIKTQRAEVTEVAERELGRELKPSEVDRYWRGRALRFAREHPGDALVLLARKALLVVSSVEIWGCYLLEIDRELTGWLGLACLPFGPIMALALLGLVALARRRAPAIALTATLIGTVAAMLLFYVTCRYRMMLAPVAIVLAGGGLDLLLRSWGRWRSWAWMAAGVAALCVVSLPVFQPVPAAIADPCRASYWANLGNAFEELGRMEEAVEAHERALGLDPGEPRFHAYKFYALCETGSGPREALRWARQMSARFPDLALAHALLAEACMRGGMDVEAEGALDRALALDPGDPDVLLRLGILHGRREEHELARRTLWEGLERSPEHPGLQYNYAFACHRLGDLEEARRWARRHLRENPGNPRGERLLEEIRARSRGGNR